MINMEVKFLCMNYTFILTAGAERYINPKYQNIKLSTALLNSYIPFSYSCEKGTIIILFYRQEN